MKLDMYLCESLLSTFSVKKACIIPNQHSFFIFVSEFLLELENENDIILSWKQ